MSKVFPQFDQTKIDSLTTYVNNTRSECVPILQQVINKIQFFSSQEIIDKVRTQFKLFVETQGSNKCAIIVDTDKWGSDHWILVEIYDLIPEHFIICDEKHVSESIDHVVIIDDAIYTGSHVSGLVYNFMTQKSITIISALATVSAKSIIELYSMLKGKEIGTKQKTIDFYYDTEIPVICQIFEDDQSMDWKCYNILMEEIVYDYVNQSRPNYTTWGDAKNNCTMVYLEHKIPEALCTIKYVISSIVASPVNRQPIIDAKLKAKTIPKLNEVFTNIQLL